MPTRFTYLPIIGLDGITRGALVPTTPTILGFARANIIPSVLPGGCEWELQGDFIRVYGKSQVRDRVAQLVEDAADYLWSFRRRFGRFRRLPIASDVSDHRRKYCDRKRQLDDARLSLRAA